MIKIMCVALSLKVAQILPRGSQVTVKNAMTKALKISHLKCHKTYVESRKR